MTSNRRSILASAEAHSGDLFPRDVRLPRFGFVGQILDSFADHFEFSKCGILSHPLGEKRLSSSTRLGPDVLESVADMFEVSAIVFHKEAASARIRSCR